MRHLVGIGARAITGIALAALLAACAAASKAQPASPQSEASPGHATPPSSPSSPYAQAPPAPPPPPAPQPQPGTSPMPPAQPGGAAPPQPRALAIQSAANEVETSQRELDVAAGDCRNACRALGSMDRAAGRLCGLTQGDPETRRCDDARQRVYSARDRVKATCGQCEGGPSVERSAPIPSLR